MWFGVKGWQGILGAGALTIATVGCIPDTPPPPQSPGNQTAGSTAAPDGQAAPDNAADSSASELLQTVERMKAEVKNRPRDFDINIALGNLYYENGKFIDAIEYFTDALAIAAPTEKSLHEGQPAPKGPVPESCRIDQPTPEQQKQGQRFRSFEDVVRAAGKLSGAEARICTEQLIPSISNTYARRGSSWYLVGNAEKAQADHAHALELDPNNAEALFFSGAALLETARGDSDKLARGKAFWERLLKVAPDHPRAEFVRQTLPKIDQMFGPHPENAMAGHPPVADGAANPLPAGAEAMAQSFQHTPENEAALDKITEKGEDLLKQSKWSDALTQFKQVMPFRPSGRIALDMGIALRELGSPKAEMVLTQATRMPGGDTVRARYELAVFYAKTQPQQAKAMFSELQNDPKVGSDAKAQLAKLQ